jgi:thiamine biosynthesis lipoprotein
MNRRDFLSLDPARLARSAGHAVGALLPDAPPAPPPDLTLLRLARRAMACTFEVALPVGSAHDLGVVEGAFDLLDRLESQLTVYRDNSEISRLNRLAWRGPTRVEPRLFDLLALAARLSADTDGAFDITAGALVKAWGFFRPPRRVPPPEERADVLTRCGMRHVVLDEESETVRFEREGLEINLGAIGKGYALDRMAAALRAEEIGSGLLHGGTSSVYALGCPPGDERGWAVGVTHPWEPGRRLAVVRLRDRGLGTSAATFRHLEHEGRKLGHILDPRSGWPAEGVAGVSVVAPTAAEADALATAFYILGPEGAARYCATHPQVGAVLLPDGADRPLIFNLGPDEAELL